MVRNCDIVNAGKASQREDWGCRPVVLCFCLLLSSQFYSAGVPRRPPPPQPIDPETAGFFTKYFVYPMSEALDFFAALLWNEYGLALLLLTIIVRLLILPLSIKQYRSSKQMQALQPEIQKLRDKYRDDPKKQQEELMKLFQKHGVNPMAGCLPILIQMPILIALYSAILHNGNIYSHSFLWMQLGKPDPYYILPLLAALTTFLQQKIASSQMSSNPQLQALTYVFPFLVFAMSVSFASALPLYWFYGNLFTIVQTYFMYGRGGKKGGGASSHDEKRKKREKRSRNR